MYKDQKFPSHAAEQRGLHCKKHTLEHAFELLPACSACVNREPVGNLFMAS